MENLKLILIGTSGVGKTTIRKVFFDQENPFELIQKTLEPTRGDEITFYSLGKTIAVHDLAGQQYDYWLLNPEEVFIESDLIFVIFDCREDMNESFVKIEQIHQICSQHSQKFKLVVLFHKIDLITEEERIIIQTQVDSIFKNHSQIEILLTSISKDYFMESFNSISKVLRKILFRFSTKISNRIAIKSEIFGLFKKKSIITLGEILSGVDATKDQISFALKEYTDKGIMNFDIETSQYSLTEKGEELNSQVKMVIETNAQDMMEKKDHIKGIIVSESSGRTFYSYSSEEDYFIKKFPENGDDLSITTSLISMFFTALHEFTLTLDKTGITHINIAGVTTNIVLLSKNEIFSLIFVENAKVSKSIISILENFIDSFYSLNEISIKKFYKMGFIDGTLEGNRDNILNMISESNSEIAIIEDLTGSGDSESLIKLFNDLTRENFEELDLDLLKNIIFKQILDVDLL